MQLLLVLIFIITVVKFFFAAFAAVEVSFSNAFSQSVLFRVHKGANIFSDFLLLVILLLIALVRQFSSQSSAMYGPSHLKNDVETRKKRAEEKAKEGAEAKGK